MKLDIVPKKGTYPEALGIDEKEWSIFHKTIVTEIKAYVKENNGLNCTDILISLCEKYAETPTEVAIISLIVGQMYVVNGSIEHFFLMKLGFESVQVDEKKEDKGKKGGFFNFFS